MSAYKIESGVQIPNRYRRKYPLSDMTIGDSFFVPDSESSTGSVRTACTNFSKRYDRFRFTVSRVEGGTRVWRVEK